MPPKPSGNTQSNTRSGRTSRDSPSTSGVSHNSLNIQLSKANLCFDCVTRSSDISPTQRTEDTRIFREIFDFSTLMPNDWIVNITLETCPQDVHYQQRQEQIDLLTAENTDLKSHMKRFQIYTILCEALRFCGDKVILPRVKEANRTIGANTTFLERFENWTQVTQFLRRSSTVRDDDQRWLQREINKVVESGRFYMYANDWHELFNLKLPRDQAVHAALTLNDTKNLFENAPIFGEEGAKLVKILVKWMHRSIPEKAYSTIPISAGSISNPEWPRI